MPTKEEAKKRLEVRLRMTKVLKLLTPLYNRQTDLYRICDTINQAQIEELASLQEEVAKLEAEYDQLSNQSTED